MTAGQYVIAGLSTALVLGCAHGVVVSQAFADMDRARVGPDVEDSKTLAPQEFQHAENERALAREAAQKNDLAGADLRAERARVAYERAVVLARLLRATEAEEEARTTTGKHEEEARRLASARVTFDQEASALGNELAVAKDAMAETKVGRADPAREKARLVAARSLAAEAHLLCGAARLVVRVGGEGTSSEATTHLEVAERDDVALETTFAHPPPAGGIAPIDAAAHAREGCLDALTRARRASNGASVGEADALLSGLSSHGGWDPSRDERGVVVTLRSAFKGAALHADAERQLRELGRVAAAHATFSLQVVVHDATAPTEAQKTEDQARATAALTALAAGGAASAQAATETMGARLPITDTSDPTSRARNARLDIVFIPQAD